MHILFKKLLKLEKQKPLKNILLYVENMRYPIIKP